MIIPNRAKEVRDGKPVLSFTNMLLHAEFLNIKPEAVILPEYISNSNYVNPLVNCRKTENRKLMIDSKKT